MKSIRLHQFKALAGTPSSRLMPFGLLCLLYNDWLLAPFLNPRMSIRASLISEISARSQPYHWVFQLLDTTAGIVTLGYIGHLVWYLRRIRLPYWQMLVATIACIGADSIIDALLPISCAPSLDAQCNLAGSGIITHLHLIESTIIGVVIFAAPVAWWWLSRRHQRRLAYLSSGFVLIQLFVGLSIVATRFLHLNDVGIWQRLYEFGLGLWIASMLYHARHSQRQHIQQQLTTSPELIVAE